MNIGKYIAENLPVVIGTIVIIAPFIFFLARNSLKLGIFKSDYSTLKERVDLNGREIKDLKDSRMKEREEFVEIRTATQNNGILLKGLAENMDDLTDKVIRVLERMAAHDGKID